jgi:hypothetical protein
LLPTIAFFPVKSQTLDMTCKYSCLIRPLNFFKSVQISE